jgi:hypothetical protein
VRYESRQAKKGAAADRSADETLGREPISDWSVTVKDGKFHKLFSVPIMDAMLQPD